MCSNYKYKDNYKSAIYLLTFHCPPFLSAENNKKKIKLLASILKYLENFLVVAKMDLKCFQMANLTP